jgi:hypothetical protein
MNHWPQIATIAYLGGRATLSIAAWVIAYAVPPAIEELRKWAKEKGNQQRPIIVLIRNLLEVIVIWLVLRAGGFWTEIQGG